MTRGTCRLSVKHRKSIVKLLLSGVGGKIYPILGKGRKTKKLLEKSLNPENCFIYEENGRILGFLAYQNWRHSFLTPSLRKFIATYGFFEGILKTVILLFTGFSFRVNEMHIRSIVVSKSARGRGIGTKLFNAMMSYAKKKKVKTVTLDVVNTNSRAKMLYERLGFSAVKETELWPINKILDCNFDKVIFMRKNLEIS